MRMENYAAVTIAWATALFGLVGVFISILVTISLAQLSGIRKQLVDMTSKLDNKMDESDHEKRSQICTENIKSAFAMTYARLDDKIIITDKKFCNHSHEVIEEGKKLGRLIISGT
jgi:hypothetical protein